MNKYMNSLPPLSALQTFEVVSRLLDFELASEELGLTTLAVVNEINFLENELRTHLFYRNYGKITLTENGKYFAQCVHYAFNKIIEATNVISPHTTHITLSAPPTFASKWLIPKLHIFTNNHNNINLQILASGQLSNFKEDLVDIAIRYGTPPFGTDLSFELLMKDNFISVVSPKLKAKYGKPDENENLRHYTLLHDLLKLWPDYLCLLNLNKIDRQNDIYFNQTSLAIDAALSGQGIAICHSFFVKKEIEANQLVYAFSTKLTRESGFYIVYPKSSLNNKNIQKIRDWLISLV